MCYGSYSIILTVWDSVAFIDMTKLHLASMNIISNLCFPVRAFENVLNCKASHWIIYRIVQSICYQWVYVLDRIQHILNTIGYISLEGRNLIHILIKSFVPGGLQISACVINVIKVMTIYMRFSTQKSRIFLSKKEARKLTEIIFLKQSRTWTFLPECRSWSDHLHIR